MTSSADSKISDNPLFISWYDSAWIPVLNPTNVMDYFTERNNPFYDRTCNNEVLKMQKIGVLDVQAQLRNMQGTEYQIIHVQEPILYVVRKQNRYGPADNQVKSNSKKISGFSVSVPMNSILFCGSVTLDS